MEIDKSNMRQIILESPEQLKTGLELAKNIELKGNFDDIIICGMGGSVLPADILRITLQPNLPVFVWRNYDLPIKFGKNPLIICISYSGNTEETLSALESAIAKKLTIVGISSGGKLQDICAEHNIPFVKIPAGIQPRCATGYIFSVLANILTNAGAIKNWASEINEIADTLTKHNTEFEVEGKKLAQKIGAKIPVIYASSTGFESVARIWKIKFNENSKTPSFYNVFPELNHNEMVGYTQGGKSFFVILMDLALHPRVSKRMQLTAELLIKKGVETEFVSIKEGSFIYKIFAYLLLGDWVSYYTALENNVDPTPVEMVEEFKGLMAK